MKELDKQVLDKQVLDKQVLDSLKNMEIHEVMWVDNVCKALKVYGGIIYVFYKCNSTFGYPRDGEIVSTQFVSLD